ncbi:MAG: tyrosine--tRNA ligase [Chlamydiae bacterium]|nr:tyrosine--tRNA ligase [Chlamydiota bacterium]MBI3277752.1 tyrosine--tRNA ligase [Chlamydiota bacterium]
MISPKDQLFALKRGVVDLFSEEELLKKLEKSLQENRPLRIKYGADPSAPDIHLGHTVPLRKLRQFQECGHIVVFIIGDFTATIGDPSGQSKTRPILSHDQVMANAKTYQEQIFKILRKDLTEIHFNSEWFGKMKFSDVVQLASQSSVAQMLERNDFSIRYREGKPISILEFLYPLIQGYDSVMIKSDVEIGGTDQTFNLLVGRTLQKNSNQEAQIVMTLPLLEGLDGKMKMSKSLGNIIGVTDSPKEIFGKTMSIPDELISKYFELLTDIETEAIERMTRQMKEGSLNPMEAKKILGQKIVKGLYDEENAKFALEEFTRIFSKKELPQEIEQFFCNQENENKEIWIVKVLQDSGLAPSSSEGRRLIRQGAVTLDGKRVSDENSQVVLKSGMILSAGKRKFRKVEFKTS